MPGKFGFGFPPSTQITSSAMGGDIQNGTATVARASTAAVARAATATGTASAVVARAASPVVARSATASGQGNAQGIAARAASPAVARAATASGGASATVARASAAWVARAATGTGGASAALRVRYYEYLRSILISGSGYWRLGEASSASPAADAYGTTPGTYVNSPTMGATGALGDSDQAINFKISDGVKEYVNIPSFNTATAPWTLGGWIKATNLGTGACLIGDYAGSNGMRIWLTGTTSVEVSINAGSLAYTFANLVDGNYHFIVGTYDGTNAQIFIDGVLVAGPTAKTGPLAASGNNLKLGQYGAAAGGLYDATIDDLFATPQILTANQVAELYLRAPLAASSGRASAAWVARAATATVSQSGTLARASAAWVARAATANGGASPTTARAAAAWVARAATATGGASKVLNRASATWVARAGTATGTTNGTATVARAASPVVARAMTGTGTASGTLARASAAWAARQASATGNGSAIANPQRASAAWVARAATATGIRNASPDVARASTTWVARAGTATGTASGTLARASATWVARAATAAATSNGNGLATRASAAWSASSGTVGSVASAGTGFTGRAQATWVAQAADSRTDAHPVLTRAEAHWLAHGAGSFSTLPGTGLRPGLHTHRKWGRISLSHKPIGDREN